MQTIVISGLLEMGLNDQPALENVSLAEFKEVFPASAAIQVVHPPEQVVGQSDKAKYTQAEHRRLLLPNRMLLNSYLPSRSPAPPMEEASVPRAERRLGDYRSVKALQSGRIFG